MNSYNDIQYFTYYNVIPVALVVAIPKTKAIEKLFIECKKKITEENINSDWQQFAAVFWTTVRNNSKDIFNNCSFLDTSSIFPYLFNETGIFFFTNENKIKDNTWGIHWYNGSSDSRKYLNEFDIDKIDPDKSIGDKVIYNIIHS